jgi:hypothetical protein
MKRGPCWERIQNGSCSSPQFCTGRRISYCSRAIGCLQKLPSVAKSESGAGWIFFTEPLYVIIVDIIGVIEPYHCMLSYNSIRTERASRFKFDGTLEIHLGSETLHARVCDISVTGMFLEMSNPLWVGAIFSANLLIQPPLRMEWTVSRVSPNRGIGVKVALTDSEACQRFADVLSKLGSAS